MLIQLLLIFLIYEVLDLSQGLLLECRLLPEYVWLGIMLLKFILHLQVLNTLCVMFVAELFFVMFMQMVRQCFLLLCIGIGFVVYIMGHIFNHALPYDIPEGLFSF